MSQPHIHFEKLPNGLTVLLCESHLAPVAELQLWAQVGSADERPHESGLAHFHEHMLFKGTEKRGVGDVAADIEGAGGRINAYTSFDVTVYHATLPSDRLDVGVDVLTDAVLHSAFDPEEIDREIEVVLEEIRRSEDSPTQVLGQAVFSECYRVHPYRAPILGSHESVASFDRDRVRAFFERWYTPDNIVAVAAGDFDSAQLAEQLGAAFEGRTPGHPPRERPAEPMQKDPRTVVCRAPFERVNIELAYAGVRLSDPDCAPLDLLSFILGSSESSRLNRRVKEHEGLVDRIDTYAYTPFEPGLTTASIATDADRALEAIEATVREIERIRTEPVSLEELERARANFLASEHFERESVTGLAQKLGAFHVTAGHYSAEAAYLSQLRAATPHDLLRVAREHLKPEALTVGAILAEGDADQLDEASIAAAVSRGRDEVKRTFAVPRRAGEDAELHSYTLETGAQLHVLPRREVPVVALRGAFLGGLLAETAETAGLTSFLTGMWLRGTGHHSTAGFARSTENLAAEIDSFSGRSSLGVTLEAPADTFEPGLDLLTELMLDPAFDPAELEKERADTLAAIERRQDRLAQLAFLLFVEAHYKSHPYRYPLLGHTETVSSFDVDAMRAHQARLICAPNLALAVSGDVDPDAMAIAISSRLASLPTGEFAPPTPALDPPPTEIQTVELRKERSQAHLLIGFRGVTVNDEDRFALEVMAQLLAGQGGRLFLELRDRRSLAYTVSASNVEGLAPGYFATYIATAPEKLEEARTGMLEELDRIVQLPPTQDELERAKRYMVGSHAIDQQRNSAHAAAASLNALYGLGPMADREFPARIEALTPDDILTVAQRIIRLDAYTMAVVRP